MAKPVGSTRVSHWGSDNSYQGDMYEFKGRRVEYVNLPTEKKRMVVEKKKVIEKKLYQRLKNVETPKEIDNGKIVQVIYTAKGLRHLCNTALVRLSGKYFSESSMMRIDEIFKESKYISTSHGLTHPRSDGRNLWFSYIDSDGRGVYFKTAYNTHLKAYELYDLVDKIK